mmetsp:Transcript_10853/g.13732  ORF Transcript_10853/g.13732 Transcript_10853/m.13732 type:complete len:155 (+) Transcript_10853:689-1153(+)
MKAVGVIENEIDWKGARSYFFWRLRRKLAEFDLRKKITDAGNVGRGTTALSPLDASKFIQQLFNETSGLSPEMWNDDKKMLAWMAEKNEFLEQKVVELTKANVAQEVFEVMVAGGNTGLIGSAGIVDGITRAISVLPSEEREKLKKSIMDALQL